MHIEVDRQLCCSSGMCVLTAPKTFDQSDKDGVVMVRQSELADGDYARVRLAVSSCPTSAIRLVEE